jgi:hypothetical protein
MATDTTQTPKDIPLCRTRGDTRPWTYVIQDSSGTAIDITGFTFSLTVDPEEDPASAANNLFTLTGTVTDGPGGKVEFSLSVAQADQTPAEYFYDVQMTDTGSAITTIIKAKYTVLQDITK